MNKLVSKTPLIVLGLAAVFMVASCSSTKKMESLKNEKTSIQKSLTTCNSAKAKLSADLVQANKAKAATQQKLDARNRELSALKKAVEVERQKINKMKAELNAAFSGYDKNSIKIDERDGRLIVVMQNKVLYQSGKVKIDTQGEQAIQAISKVFRNNKGLNILVESHTDDVPISNKLYKDNWDLSVARSVAVVRMLEGNGVNPTRLTAAGRGEFVPVSQIAPDDSKTKSLNRRTEFIISPKMAGLFKLLNEL